MVDYASHVERWQKVLAEYIASGASPGAALGVAVGGHVVAELAAGVSNTDTSQPVTPGTLFQVGSIAKVWTATLVMQLCENGKVDLDFPVQAYLPDFVTRDAEAAQQVTVRHLLSHQAGFDGDIYDDYGPGPEAVARYVEALAEASQLHPPGALYSYCNSGFVVLGALIEQMRGMTWDEAVKEFICRPLGLTQTVTSADEAIMRPVAVGHGRDEAGVYSVAPIWSMGRSTGPAGSSLACSARDLLMFVSQFISDAPVILSKAAVEQMIHPHVVIPGRPAITSCSLGWERFDDSQVSMLLHDGVTMGQSAFVAAVPESDLVVTLMTNGGDVSELVQALLPAVLRDLNVSPPPATLEGGLAPGPGGAESLMGSYEGVSMRVQFSQSSDRSRITGLATPISASAGQPGAGEMTFDLTLLDEDHLVTEAAPAAHREVFTFLGRDDRNQPQYVHVGGRALRRADDPSVLP